MTRQIDPTALSATQRMLEAMCLWSLPFSTRGCPERPPRTPAGPGSAMTSPVQPVYIDVRDPATAGSPVAVVTAHLDTGAAVSVHDPCQAFSPFVLVRRAGSVVVLSEDGAPLATYADVTAAMRHGLTRWPRRLLELRDTVISDAVRRATHAA